MWNALRPELKGLDPVRIESHISSGVPDVNYVHGWIELKFKDSWPKRERTPLRLEHFTKEQRTWLRKRAAAGGRVFLLLKVGLNEWLLFRGERAAVVVGSLPRADLYLEVEARWTRKPNKAELICHLCPTSKSPSASPETNENA